MIVLCPKAFSSNDGLSQEREFLKYFLSKTGKKATIVNEVWETFRFRLLNSNTEIGLFEKIIADFRGVFQPEEMKIDNNHQEETAIHEYSTQDLIEKTKNILKRRWADIDLFITTDPEQFKEIVKEKDIEMLTLTEFFLSCMDNSRDRNIMEGYWGKIQKEKWE